MIYDLILNVLDNLKHGLIILFLGAPTDSRWSTYWLVWALRVLSFSLLFRIYIGPWIVARFLNQLVVRSVSLRSIRGVHFQTQTRTLDIDRIGFSYRHATPESSGRLSIKLEGLAFDIVRQEDTLAQNGGSRVRRRRTLTLGNLPPSPAVAALWSFVSTIYSFLDPFVRPLVRAAVVILFRVVIRLLPAVTQHLDFELTSATVTSAALPGSRLAVRQAFLHTEVAFTQLEDVIPSEEVLPAVQRGLSRNLTMTAWKTRLFGSFSRTWDRAWGRTQGSIAISFRVKDVQGHTTVPSMFDESHDRTSSSQVTFLDISDAVVLDSSVSFSPRRGSLDAHSLRAALNIGNAYINLETVMNLWNETQRSSCMPASPAEGCGGNGALSPTSPMSPFLGAIQSVRSVSRVRNKTRPKSTAAHLSTWLNKLMKVDIHISTVRLSHRSINAPFIDWKYEGIMKDITFGIKLSDAESDPLHREHFGKKYASWNEDLACDVYGFSHSIGSISAFRQEPTRLEPACFLSISSVKLQLLTSQWPFQWMRSVQLMPGDPNGPLLVVRLNIGGIDVVEQVNTMQALLRTGKSSSSSTRDTSLFPALVRSVPRVVIEVECGPIRLSLLSDTAVDQMQPFILGFRTDGFTFAARSQFSSLIVLESPQVQMEYPSLEMSFAITFTLHPVFMRIWIDRLDDYKIDILSGLGDRDFDLHGYSVISVEMLEIKSTGRALCEFDEDINGPVTLDVHSIFLDIQCSSDAFLIELWHADVIKAISQLISMAGSKSGSTSQTPCDDSTNALPFGLSVAFSLPRFVIFVTAHDFSAPTEDISRGFSIRTGARIQYLAMHTDHRSHSKSLRVYLQNRRLLSLRDNDWAEILSPPNVTKTGNVFCRAAIWNAAVRSAMATRYDMDDPHIAERDKPSLAFKEWFTAPQITLSCRLNRHEATDAKRYQIVVDAHALRGVFELCHVYHALLALRTVTSLAEKRHSPPPTKAATGRLALKINVDALQFLWKLSRRHVFTRIDTLNADIDPGQCYNVCSSQVSVSVPVPSEINRWNADTGESWEQFCLLRDLVIRVPSPSEGSSTIEIEVGRCRLRIPYGYVPANLITAANVTFKVVRHLIRTVKAGEWKEIPSPSPEDARHVPDINIQFGALSLEAADDAFESKLSLIFQAGLRASPIRLDRDEAFRVKVAAILANKSSHPSPILTQELDSEYQFSPEHSVSIEEARERLSQVHIRDWIVRLQQAHSERAAREEATVKNIIGKRSEVRRSKVLSLVSVQPVPLVPPLFRASFSDLHANIKSPSFPLDALSEFFSSHGDGLPPSTEYTLLLPMHLDVTMSSAYVTVKDYPLPLLDVPKNACGDGVALRFRTDLVIAEEIGASQSIDWLECTILDGEGAHELKVKVPKTMMPVKTYASPLIDVTTDGITCFSWNMSYSSAIQDFMRVVEALSHPSRDSSPTLGFWDKIRLIFHWTFKMTFKQEVRLYMKGSRDPRRLGDNGAGFALCCQGNPRLLIGLRNEEKEVIQLISDSMSIIIPDFDQLATSYDSKHLPARSIPRAIRKTCAKLNSGVRLGVGFVLERSCGPECPKCAGSALDRTCRFFDFKPHHAVRLEKKSEPPALKGLNDSYNGFRSDFIHMSISLTSSIHKFADDLRPSSLHLTPKAFGHFWSWWRLFDGLCSLPIRQGNYFPRRNISPKFGRHLATIKWRLSFDHLFVAHAYMDESQESWRDGVTPFVGAKAMIEHFHADMHQRDQEIMTSGTHGTNGSKVSRRKVFYAAEVVLKNLDLRAVLAIYQESLKQFVSVASSPGSSNYRTRNDMRPTPLSSPWIDLDDFVECDWTSTDSPTVHLLPAVQCPHFTYVKHNAGAAPGVLQPSKFGSENSHNCLLGQEPSVPQVQINLALERIAELQRTLAENGVRFDDPNTDEYAKNQISVQKMIALIEDYIAHLRAVDLASHASSRSKDHSYYMPSDTVSPDEWAQFENVYQVHSPQIHVSDAIRDIMMQYYYCSRAKKGFEYHMATRAVKFIRDQAAVMLPSKAAEVSKRSALAANTAQAAAVALRKFLGVDTDDSRTSVEVSSGLPSQSTDVIDPLSGWSDGISLRKSHFVLLLKPQFILRCEGLANSVCVLAAVQAKLQSFTIMDSANVDDSISGKIMTRNYTSLNGLQVFAPSNSILPSDGCLPLEVLIDFKCESRDFDRLVPQTDANFHYDKFNRLRLRNNITSVAKANNEPSTEMYGNHLHNQMDLVRVHIPRFTVSATDKHFQAISNIVTHLILFSDPAHKMRLDKLETLLFTYDFTDLQSAAEVVVNLQGQMRSAIETQSVARRRYGRSNDETVELELLKLKAHVFLLAEELTYIFDAIKLAQDRIDERNDQKSALLLHASSSEISWRMLDEKRDLLAKLAVRSVDYYWLSRQDSSTVNNLTAQDIQVYDGSPHAMWSEILSKYNEPSSHPLFKRGLFLVAGWTVLSPVGGITIYEDFQVDLHPMRLQLDARVGIRIMEYMWPGRKNRKKRAEDKKKEVTWHPGDVPLPKAHRSSLDSPQTPDSLRKSLDSPGLGLPTLRKLGSSRSFTDLHSAMSESRSTVLPRLRSSSYQSGVQDTSTPDEAEQLVTKKRRGGKDRPGDAAEMKTRSSQKTFVYVRISSLYLLLSILKEESFECRDARIRTRDLEFRNQTWSFEELVDQFIPSDLSWTGWVKMAFNQPLVPVLPVARELISKTKWITSKGSSHGDRSDVATQEYSPTSSRPQRSSPSSSKGLESANPPAAAPRKRWRLKANKNADVPQTIITSATFTDEPEPLPSSESFQLNQTSGDVERPVRVASRARIKSLFSSRSSSMAPPVQAAVSEQPKTRGSFGRQTRRTRSDSLPFMMDPNEDGS